MCAALRELMKDEIMDAEIKSFVNAGRKFNISDNDIINSIISEFGVTLEEAKKYVLPAMA